MKVGPLIYGSSDRALPDDAPPLRENILFGLAHAPGYVLRDGSAMEAMKEVPSALSAAAYSIAIVSPMGILFGVLWARTRSLLLVVLLHGWADTVPALAPFVRTWFG